MRKYLLEDGHQNTVHHSKILNLTPPKNIRKKKAIRNFSLNQLPSSSGTHTINLSKHLQFNKQSNILSILPLHLRTEQSSDLDIQNKANHSNQKLQQPMNQFTDLTVSQSQQHLFREKQLRKQRTQGDGVQKSKDSSMSSFMFLETSEKESSVMLSPNQDHQTKDRSQKRVQELQSQKQDLSIRQSSQYGGDRKEINSSEIALQNRVISPRVNSVKSRDFKLING